MNAEQQARIRYAGKIRRVCDFHKYLLEKTYMAVLDEDNCDYCARVRELTKSEAQ